MGGVAAMAFSPDGTELVTAGSSFEDAARTWGDTPGSASWRPAAVD
jgi:hypothetical protein